jgi:hypothetical protein
MIRLFNLDLKFRENPYAGDSNNYYIRIVFGACPGAINEVNMERVFKCKNGTIHVELPESCDREKLKKATEDFLRKVISGRAQNGNSNTSRNFREK